MIVVAEDNRLVRELICNALDLHCHRCVAFDTADAAWTYLEENSGKISLLVTDVCMPGILDGIDLAKLTVHLLDIPVIISTAWFDNGRLDQSLECELLLKPWSIESLIDACHRKIKTT